MSLEIKVNNLFPLRIIYCTYSVVLFIIEFELSTFITLTYSMTMYVEHLLYLYSRTIFPVTIHKKNLSVFYMIL